MVQTSSFHSERRTVERFLVSLPVETDSGPGVTRDVSVSGLYLVTEEPLSVGDLLQLTMAIPDPETLLSLRLGLVGRVVRVEEAQGVVGAGIALDEGGRYVAQAS